MATKATRKGPGKPAPESPLEEIVWWLGLAPLRGSVIASRFNPDTRKTDTTYRVGLLNEAESADFKAACSKIRDAAQKAGVAEMALAKEIANAVEEGARLAVRANATRIGRLSPEERQEYRAQAAAAQSLAQFLAREITGRDFPAKTEGPITYLFSEGDDRHPSALADLLRQRIGLTLEADDRGASIGCDCGPRSVAPGLCRVVQTINNLHWIAELLRGDVARARPEGRRKAAWKPTAALLRALFEERLGVPLVDAVAVLAGLAHRCDVPPEAVSKLSKP